MKYKGFLKVMANSEIIKVYPYKNSFTDDIKTMKFHHKIHERI